MLRRLPILPLAACVVVVVAWSAGCLLNDRWAWSQWLWWIPAPLALAASLVWTGCARLLAPGVMRRRLIMAGLVAGVISSGATLRSLRLVDFAHGPSSLHMLCWNARWPGEQAQGCAEALVPWAGRVMVISNPGRMAEHASTWMRPGDAIVEAGTFLLTGPVRVIEARPIVQGDDGFATLFRFDAPQSGETRVLAIDLPSSPFRPRHAALARFAGLVGAAVDLRTIDLVVGDFNCTRGSASVLDAFPGFEDAWSQRGQGWGASWPRETPLLHIDLALASPSVRVERCELHDPGTGHHMINTLSFTNERR